MTTSHASHVENQFGARADAYVSSSVHSQGMGLDELEALIRARPPARILDLGCGGGHASFRAAPHAEEVMAYDLSPRMLAAVTEEAERRGLANIRTECGRVEALPFADASFDIVMSRLSAHHWTGWDAGLKEAARVAKPGGLAVFIDSVSPGEALLDSWLQTMEVLRDTSHVRSYSHGEWLAGLVRAGFLPGSMANFRIRLEFASWIERIGTPKIQADAIRALQARMPEPVAQHFALEPDGAFSIDIALFEARKPA
jgi:ubiquinone/menaquinone biosynthesis C-methylase UbiE